MKAMNMPTDATWSTWWAELERLRESGLWLPGPATALEVLGNLGVERAHQNYLAWLLDPRARAPLRAVPTLW